MNVGEKAIKEFHVALAVEDHHRDVVTVFGRPDDPAQVLRNDVAQQRRLSRSGHSQHDSLHHPNAVGPKPRSSVHVVAEDYGTWFQACRMAASSEFWDATSGGWGHCFSRRERAVRSR